MKLFTLFMTILALTTAAEAAPKKARLKVQSETIHQGKMMTMEQVFSGFGCTGQNISPQLSWSGAPAGTKSYAVMAYDPDAPTGSGWWHWVVFNIPATVTELKLGAGSTQAAELPKGAVQSRTDFGKPGYGGPCPPPGRAHRYIFTVYALPVEKLELDENATAAMVGFMINGHAIGEGKLMARYKR